MKRHVISLFLVSLALLLLFKFDYIAKCQERISAYFSPKGFIVRYYRSPDFKDVICTRHERRVLRDYGESRPALGVPSDSYAARWEASLIVPEDGDYSFFLQSQGSARFWIGDDLVIDKWDDHKWKLGKHGKKHLAKGVYRVMIEHVKHSGSGAIRLRWAGGPIPDNTVMGAPYVRKISSNN